MKKILGLLVSLIVSFSNIEVDGKTNVYVEKSLNGVDIINISSPTKKGVSYSTFKEFNVSEKGAVINNAKNIARSNIAGLINGNKNINKTRAKLALLDVTGTEESRLKGILEAISKDKLDVILSNPNGITLDGASFLNIHNMALTTGKVNIDENTNVSYTNPIGDIKTLKELNTKENLEIIANKFSSNSDIYAKELKVKTYAGEDGIELSADILGSVYGDVVKIVATKSGIGVKNITSKDLSLESKKEANIESIKTDNLNIKVEEDFNNKGKIISNESINIEAKNILNDGNILISDNISLKAKEKISNLNGAIIHADRNLNLESDNLDNIGRVNSYGLPIVKYKDKDGNIVEDIEKWKTKLKESYVSYNAGIRSSTDEAKINALSAFYDKNVVIDPKEFDWRIYKDSGDVKYNKERANKPGIFYNLSGSEILSSERIEEIKSENEAAMYSEYSDNYLGKTKENTLLKGYVENSNIDTSFSILSGNDIKIKTKNIINNKDSHIIANKDNIIKANTYNNSSSISDNKITIQDGYEKMIFDGSFNCPGGLVYCNILHNATYIRDLGNNREVNLKGLPSFIKGENINIEAENVNFSAYNVDESKKTLREEDERYINNKEEIEINGKKIEYSIEDNPKYIKLSNFLNNPYFLNNIKYNSNNRYLIDEFKLQDKKNKEIEEKKVERSNITINAKNLNIKAQKLLFDNINLSSNNILVEGASLKALDNLNIKSDNIILKSIIEEKVTYLVSDEVKFINRYEDLKRSTIEANNIFINSKETNLSGDIKVKENIDILSEKLNITGDKITNREHIINNYTDILEKEEKIDNSTINAKNISIKSKETNILSTNLNVDNKINIDSDKLLITNEKGLKELKRKSNKEYLLDKKEVSNSSNINSKEIDLNNSVAEIKASNVISDKLIGKEISIKSDILNNRYIKKSNNITYEENTDIKYQENRSSNILVKDIKAKSLNVEGSNLKTNTLEVKDLNVKSKVLNNDLKQRIETFNLVDNVNGHVDKENLKVDGSITLFSHKINKKDNSYQLNEKSNVVVKEKAKIDKLDILSSNVELNNGDINNINVKSQDLKNTENENNYSGGLNLSGSIGITGIGAKIELNIQNHNSKITSKIHEENNLNLKGNTTIEKELDVTNTNLNYDNLVVNAKKVNFRAIKDEIDKKENITNITLGVNANVRSPIAKDILKVGKGIKNLLDGNKVKAISNVANGFVEATYDLSSNIKVKKENGYEIASSKDLEDVKNRKEKLEKDISGYINIGGDVSLNVSNKTILSHNEKVKGNTLIGNKIVFNNNEEINYTSTKIKESEILYNNVKDIKKDVLVAENKEEVIDANVSLGISSSLDTKEMKLSPANINIGVKGSYEIKEEKENALNELSNVKEVYNNVGNVRIKGLNTKDSILEGSIDNLSIKEVKDEIKKNKVGAGFDISLNVTGMPTGGNVESEFIDKREEKVFKNNINLTNLKTNILKIEEEKEKNHDIDLGTKVGTSGISGRVGDLELSTRLIDAISNPKEFKHKLEMAKKDIESSGKALVDSINNVLNTKEDEDTDISEEERRSLKEISNYHLNAEYVLNDINEKEAKDKKQREILILELKFKGLKTLDRITEENVDKFPEGIKKRYYELKERGEELSVAVDNVGNVYTFGDMSELEFKKALAREYGIHSEKRKTSDGKILGATVGNIYSEYVINGNEDIEELEKDNIEDIPSDVVVVSDKVNTVNSLEKLEGSSRHKEELEMIIRKLGQKKLTNIKNKENDKKIFERKFLGKMSDKVIEEYNKLSEEEKINLSKKIVDLFYDGVKQRNIIKNSKLEKEINKIIKDSNYTPAAIFEYMLNIEEIRSLTEDYIYDISLDDGSANIDGKPRNIVNSFDLRKLKKITFENGKIKNEFQKLISGDTLIINDKKMKISSIIDKKMDIKELY